MAMRSFEECKELLNNDRNLYNYLAFKVKAWLELMDTTAAWSTMPNCSRVRYWQQMSMCCTTRMFLPLHVLGLSSKQLKQLAAADSSLSMLMAMQSQYQEDVVYPDTDAPPVAPEAPAVRTLINSSSIMSSSRQLCPAEQQEMVYPAAGAPYSGGFDYMQAIPEKEEIVYPAAGAPYSGGFDYMQAIPEKEDPAGSPYSGAADYMQAIPEDPAGSPYSGAADYMQAIPEEVEEVEVAVYPVYISAKAALVTPPPPPPTPVAYTSAAAAYANTVSPIYARPPANSSSSNSVRSAYYNRTGYYSSNYRRYLSSAPLNAGGSCHQRSTQSVVATNL